jgi:hypothetical protein
MKVMPGSLAPARWDRAPHRLIASIAIAVVAAARVAEAEPADAGPAGAERSQAAALFADGNAAMARDDAVTAAERYRAAWRLAPEARFAINLGIALAVQGRNAAAAEAFTVYLADPAADPDKRAVLEARLRSWGAELGEIVLDVTPAAASIEIDGAPPLRSAPGTRIPIAAGSHLVTARARGHQARELRLEVGRHQQVVARFALAPSPRVDAGSDPDRGEAVGRSDVSDRGDGSERMERSYARPGKWAALGIAVAAAGAGSYFAATAIERWHRVDDHCPGGGCTSPSDLALAGDARSAGTRADIAFVVSGAALVAALVLWRLEPRPHAARAVSLVPQSSGGLLCITGAL